MSCCEVQSIYWVIYFFYFGVIGWELEGRATEAPRTISWGACESVTIPHHNKGTKRTLEITCLSNHDDKQWSGGSPSLRALFSYRVPNALKGPAEVTIVCETRTCARTRTQQNGCAAAHVPPPQRCLESFKWDLARGSSEGNMSGC